jgi:hypothetical protein
MKTALGLLTRVRAASGMSTTLRSTRRRPALAQIVPASADGGSASEPRYLPLMRVSTTMPHGSAPMVTIFPNVMVVLGSGRWMDTWPDSETALGG